MSTSNVLQNLAIARLQQPGALRVAVPVLARLTEDYANEIDRADSMNKGLAVWVLPILPKRITQGISFVFYEAAELRVRIIEFPKLNTYGADAYDLMDDVSLALHFQGRPEDESSPFRAILSHPLYLSSVETIEGPVPDLGGQIARAFDVVFTAVYAPQPTGGVAQ